MDCVSEGSYHILYVTAIVTAFILLIGSAYFWDKFNKVKNSRLTKREEKQAQGVAMAGVVVSVIGIGVLIMLFFGFRRRMVGMMQTVRDVDSPDIF